MFKFYKIFTAKQKEYCGLERPIFSFRFFNFMLFLKMFSSLLFPRKTCIYVNMLIAKTCDQTLRHNWPVFELASFYPSGNLDIFERYGISLYFSDNTKVCGFKISQ